VTGKKVTTPGGKATGSEPKTKAAPVPPTQPKQVVTPSSADKVTAPTTAKGCGRGVPSVDELSNAAGIPDKGGYTKAGRALQKHGSRPGSVYERPTSGKPNVMNQAGQNVVDDILTTPGSQVKPNRLGGVDVVAPDGRGVRYNADGSFRGFLEPNK
jgi:hypothetical protein